MAKTDNYLLKITNASPIELVVITYDILIDDINEAIINHGINPAIYIESINGARDALMELIGALDGSHSVAHELYPLYIYVNKLLISALTYERISYLEDALQILGSLRESWITVRDTEPKDEAIYKNAPKVYSGLTYGRKGPNDYVDTNPKRGIQV